MLKKILLIVLLVSTFVYAKENSSKNTLNKIKKLEQRVSILENKNKNIIEKYSNQINRLYLLLILTILISIFVFLIKMKQTTTKINTLVNKDTDDVNAPVQSINYCYIKQYRNAIKSYEKDLEINPDNYTAYYNMGVTYGSNAKYEESINAYKKAIQINPNSESSYTNLFEISLLSNNFIDKQVQTSYLDKFKDNKNSLIKYEMIKIFQAIKNNEIFEAKLKEWEEKYKEISLGDWSFHELENWIEEEPHPNIKENLIICLDFFKKHKDKFLEM